MTNQKIETILVWIVKISVYLTTLAPLILSAAFFFPAIFPKAVFIRLLVELALMAYLPLIFLAPRYRPRYNIIYGALGLFVLLTFITAAHGVNWQYSFWGNYERMDGIFSWLHFWGLLVMAASVFKTKREWQTLFGASILIAMAVSGYGFLQKLGSSLVYDSGAFRITGTIGNPGFLAAYLLFNITFALTIVTDKLLAWRWRLLSGLALFWLLLGIFYTSIRGAWLGFLVALILFAIGYTLWIERHKTKYWILGALAAGLVLIALLFVFRQADFVAKNSLINKYFNISLSESTAQTRLISWRGALQGLPDYLWLGVGPQKFDVIFNKYVDPRFYALVGNETWWDRAHNMALEVLATMGVLGLASYLLVGLALFWALWQLGRRQVRHRTEALVLAAFLVAYFIQNLFVFDSTSTYLTLAFLVGYIISRSHESGPEPESREVIGRGRRPLIVVMGLSLVLIGSMAYVYNIKLIKHNLLFLKTLAYAGQRPLMATVNAYRAVLDLSDFDQREVVIKLGQYLGQVGLGGKLTVGDLTAGYNFWLVAADKAIKANPDDVRLLLSYGNSVNVYAELMKSQDAAISSLALQKAERALRAAAALGRSRQQVFYSLANTYLIAGDNKKGIEILEQAARIHDDTPTSYWLLAFAYQQSGNNEAAIATADKALDRNYVFSDEKEANPIASLYLERKDYKRLLRLYQRVASTTSTGTAQARLAALYAQMGQKEEALAAAEAVIARDPSLRAQVEEFIEQVKSGSKKDFLGI